MPDRESFFDLLGQGKHVPSGNRNDHKHTSTQQEETECPEDREVYAKGAVFCLAVAATLIFADVLGQGGHLPEPVSDQNVMRDVTLVVHFGPRHRDSAGLLPSFRLSNMGRRAIFYPVLPGTNAPVGQILVRDSHSSEWTNPAGKPGDRGSEVVEPNLAWIEMPPGGWVDGEYVDHVQSVGDHVYAVFLKPERNAATVRIVSKPYHLNRE